MARHSNELLIEKFYKNFQKLNAEEMVDCYHPDIHFSDPAFGDLQGKDAGDMWRMLCGNAKDLRILFDRVSAGDRDGSAHWEAHYTFSQTGRKVHNIIEARFVFQDGYIIRHADAFDIWRWSGMALGIKGSLLGWTPLVKNAIRGNALKALRKFQER
ncbi:MAG TPA: nuclear transport factor 2 family protein [Calditrichia bacterium]|nr:nuclear transport factor 2 family protein [Calditrichota bacterium]HQU71920.1 nuclear transport factor 2 family protein [Calditrichia bacterium]HQV31219.1 nuclear transport factor 2 family protein [Calditrichia bacterium]